MRKTAAATFLLVLVVLGYNGLGLPSSDQIEASGTQLVLSYGYALLFVAALLESVFIVGLYFPGTTLLVVGIALAPTVGLVLPLVALSMGSGAALGYGADYAIGRLGWHIFLGPQRDPALGRMKKFVAERGRVALAVTTVYPFFGAPASVSAGVLGMGAREFGVTMVVSTAIWTLVWSVVLSAGSSILLRLAGLLNLTWLLLAMGLALAVMVLWRLARARTLRRTQHREIRT